MTSLLPSSTTRARSTAGAMPRRRRPLVLVAGLGGFAAAAATLLLCLAVALVGWFLTDAGAHGTPRSALRVGALGWLMGHGSGLRIEGTAVTAVPLGITLLAAWSTWRVGHRVGVGVSSHGPDADGIADGQRDWTVPAAATVLTAGYALTAAVTTAVAGTATTAPSGARVLLWCLVLGVVVGGPAVAVGSGRAAIWATAVPRPVAGTVDVCRRVLRWWLVTAGAVLVAALVVDLGTALNILAQLRTDAGESGLLLALTLLVLPNALGFSGAYLLGPGFAVGAGTLVAPTAVVVGPLPMFPLLAALPDSGPVPAWVAWLMVLPPVVAAVATVRALATGPALPWLDALLRGCLGGALAGLAFGVLAALAGGAVGPGRMHHVGPPAGEVLGHAVVTFGLAGLLGALVSVVWQRRTG